MTQFATLQDSEKGAVLHGLCLSAMASALVEMEELELHYVPDLTTEELLPLCQELWSRQNSDTQAKVLGKAFEFIAADFDEYWNGRKITIINVLWWSLYNARLHNEGAIGVVSLELPESAD